MKKRLKLLGWIALLFIFLIFWMMFVLIFPVWGIVWIITGRHLPAELMTWAQDRFPPEVTS